MALSRITDEAKARMKKVLEWRRQGRTLADIGRELKVTRERVRQIQKLGERIFGGKKVK